jgi:hypothetical protein
MVARWNLLQGAQERYAGAILEESLRLDPDDRATHLLLTAHYRRKGRLQDARRVLEKLDAGAEIPAEVLRLFDRALRGGSPLDLSHPESEAVCETLRRLTLNPARLLYATAALKRWPADPLFELHVLEAKHRGPMHLLSLAEIERAQRAAERARSTGDARTAHRLESLLMPPAFVPPFLEDEEPATPDELGSAIGEAEMDALIDLLSRGPMRRHLKDLERDLGRAGMREALRELLDEMTPPGELPPLPLPSRRPKPRSARGGRRRARSRSEPGAPDPAPGPADGSDPE